VVFPAGKAVHRSRLRALVRKLVSDPDLRNQYRRELHFPLERHYSDYGVFPEEPSL
jgi:hypothetical protein